MDVRADAGRGRRLVLGAQDWPVRPVVREAKRCIDYRRCLVHGRHDAGNAAVCRGHPDQRIKTALAQGRNAVHLRVVVIQAHGHVDFTRGSPPPTLSLESDRLPSETGPRNKLNGGDQNGVVRKAREAFRPDSVHKHALDGRMQRLAGYHQARLVARRSRCAPSAGPRTTLPSTLYERLPASPCSTDGSVRRGVSKTEGILWSAHARHCWPNLRSIPLTLPP